MRLNKKHTSLLGLLSLLIGLAFFIWPKQKLFHEVPFTQLPGWNDSHFNTSFQTFQASCRVFMKQDPNQMVGTKKLPLRAKDWYPACRQALTIHKINDIDAQLFFEHWFLPIEFYDGKPVEGLFTGYYMPSVKGSHKQSSTYNVPLYELPKDLITVDLGLFNPSFKKQHITGRVEGNTLIPYYTREEINKGVIKNQARVLAWIQSPIDRMFLEIQGSAIIEFDDGEKTYINYDAENGAAYTAIAGVLIKQGAMTKHNASMQAIKKYLEAHPQEMDKVLNQNKSFVFFQKGTQNAAIGSQGIALTPEYSMAVDLKWIPIGTPIWLSTTQPDTHHLSKSKPLNRLMIAQDTGGAIRGKVRGDVYWGGGEKATSIAGHMKNKGYYWLLIPREALTRLKQGMVQKP